VTGTAVSATGAVAIAIGAVANTIGATGSDTGAASAAIRMHAAKMPEASSRHHHRSACGPGRSQGRSLRQIMNRACAPRCVTQVTLFGGWKA